MSYPTTPQAWLSEPHAAALENTLVCGLDSGWSDGQASFGPFDELEAAGLLFLRHDGFLTVGFEGDSETIVVAGREHEAVAAEAIKAAQAMVEASD